MGEERRIEYTYLPLGDAMKAVGQRVNLFAAVIQIDVPRRSSTTDYVLTLKIADQSYETTKMSVNFFAGKQENMPHVKSHGDIICLHRVTISVHSGEVYAVFKKRVSSFALFEGENSATSFPYQTSTKFKGLPQDEEFTNQIRTWLLTCRPNSDSYILQLNEIKINKVFDLVCKVLHVFEIFDGAWLMLVWDGTDTPPVDLHTDLDMELSNPCPLHLEEFSLSRKILQTFPRGGTILRLVTMRFIEEIPQLQDGARWVRFRNVTCQLQSGIWKGILQPCSKIFFLSKENDVVLTRQRLYIERIQSKDLVHLRPMLGYPQSSPLIVTDDEVVANGTLMDSLSHPEVVHKLKCVVRVVSACPWKGEDLISPTKGYYRIRLTLEDPTARIHCYIFREEGVKFFGGRHPPISTLTKKMNSLLGIGESNQSDDRDGGDMCGAGIIRRNPPWVSVCLKSYYLDEEDPWGSRLYEISGTQFVG